MSTTTEALAKAEAELLAWATGQRSHHNEVHGSVIGDYPGQIERTARGSRSAPGSPGAAALRSETGEEGSDE